MNKALVETRCGKLQGSTQESLEGFSYYAFKGVPYAKPPVGKLRFEDPQPPERWTGTRDATKFGPACAQYDQISRTFIGTDDCLYLNIYVKSIKSETKLPVMMWIHGGAFTFGCGDDSFYGPQYLLRKGIVLVTINYRLGVFGFLNLEDEVAPGNQGLKDQVMALKWIKTNISKFGGDPNNVTIFGESSGAACVNYLGLSPLAKGLFHKAISQSGSALNTWATTPTPTKYAHALCEKLGKQLKNPKEIVDFLKTIDCLQLAEVQEKMRTTEKRLQLLYPFGPGVDDKSKNPFMPVPVSEAAKNGLEVPYLLGHNNREGLYALTALQNTSLDNIQNNFEKMLHPNLIPVLQQYNLTPGDLKRIYKKEITNDTYVEYYADLLGDMYIVEGIHKMIKLHVLKNRKPIYYYNFLYDQGISFTKLMLNVSISGASHFDELPHLFDMKFQRTMGLDPLKEGSVDYRIMEQMTEMWTNFARIGRPTPVVSKLLPKKWPPISNPMLFKYMKIDRELQVVDMMNIEHRLSGGRPVKSNL